MVSFPYAKANLTQAEPNLTPGLSRIEGYVIVLKVAGPVVIEEGEYQGVKRGF